MFFSCVVIFIIVSISTAKRMAPNDPAILYEGRYQVTNSGHMEFDQPGCRIIITVSGATEVSMEMTKKYVGQPNRFIV